MSTGGACAFTHHRPDRARQWTAAAPDDAGESRWPMCPGPARLTAIVRRPAQALRPAGSLIAPVVMALAVVLSGCSSAPQRPAGGYYLDDGPPEGVAVDDSGIADVTPRIEPLRTAAMRPYTALGMRFVPMTRLEPYRARGRASWYGRRFHGKPTASGEPYDMMAMSAAHPTLPIPSYVRVTHLANGRQVVVRVNDRGPFHSDRLIDLSYAAARKLDFVTAGSARVEVELILPESEVRHTASASHRLQLGAYGSARGATDAMETLQREMPWLSSRLIVRAGSDGLHRIFASPFASHDEATRAADRIRRDIALHPIIQPETSP